MGEETKKLTEDLIDISILIFVAIIFIFFIFSAIKQLSGQLPAYVASIILGLGGIFLYATNKKIREHIHKWLKYKE